LDDIDLALRIKKHSVSEDQRQKLKDWRELIRSFNKRLMSLKKGKATSSSRAKGKLSVTKAATSSQDLEGPSSPILVNESVSVTVNMRSEEIILNSDSEASQEL
jgi:hypothetical protein